MLSDMASSLYGICVVSLYDVLGLKAIQLIHHSAMQFNINLLYKRNGPKSLKGRIFNQRA